jgi:hypothetical protein
MASGRGKDRAKHDGGKDASGRVRDGAKHPEAPHPQFPPGSGEQDPDRITKRGGAVDDEE